MEMPGIASLESPLVQQSRREIKSLAAEIASLAHSVTEPAEFHSGFLERLIAAIGAVGGAIWHCDNADSMQLLGMQSLPAVLFADSQSADARQPSTLHGRILRTVVSEGQPMLIPPGNVRLDVERPANPLEHALIIVPVAVQEATEYLIEIVQRPSGGPATQRGYLRFVAQMADLFADYQRQLRLRTLSHNQRLNDDMGRALVELASCSTDRDRHRCAVQWLRELSGADHAVLLGGVPKPRVLAIADTGSFDPRSELIIAIEQMVRRWQQLVRIQLTEALASATTSAKHVYRFDLAPPSLAEDAQLSSVAQTDSELRNACTAVAQQLNTGTLLWLPVDRPANTVDDVGHLSDRQPSRGGDSTATGFSVLLAVPQSPSNSTLAAFLEQAIGRGRFVGALAELLARPAPAWRMTMLWGPFTGRSNWLRRAVVYSITAMGLLGVACLPVPQRVAAVAELHPVNVQHYYATMQGVVGQVFVQDGQHVSAGQPLAMIENNDLDASILRLNGQIARVRESINGLREQLAKLDRSTAINSRNSQANDLELQFDRGQVELEELENELALRLTQRDRLTLRARGAGRVVVEPNQEQLLGRVVSVNESLLKVYADDDRWRFDVAIPERRFGLLLSTSPDATAVGNNVTLVVHGFSDRVLRGRLERVADQTVRSSNLETTAQAERVLLAHAYFEADELPVHKDGVLARATIDCGRTPLGWLLVRDAYQYLDSSVRLMW